MYNDRDLTERERDIRDHAVRMARTDLNLTWAMVVIFALIVLGVLLGFLG